ncbi:amino acid ABC transporter substrate-binding protein, PAAT family [Clostridium amylolyticum]|uniref:Amino acid ABC transporter substrate-binding protein, PAAT family n=1 Tax=Clostridium amylolyticum TaxID=1121298 RepID=A0A1M6GXT1_9CLOT|nr:transporter substrate-binding domain-containing protein [Clostridium amylolyticum]SHJ14700.1 amino acid ABC transporter substrate-binding protein, PAAT family [Clostridium amylolyticum]
MKKTKILYLFASILMVVFIMAGCASNNKPVPSKGDGDKEELVIGMELAYPPFETTDEKGNPTGLSVEMSEELGKYLGKKVKIENMAFNGLIPALQTKKIDLIISSMSITEERLKSIDFSKPYARINLALLINKNSPVNSIQDLNVKGRKVAVKKGTTGHSYAEANLKNAEIMVFDKESACVLEVVQGKADAFIYDQLTVHKNWKQYPQATKVNLQPFEDKSQEWGIGMRKENPELKEKINAFIDDFKSKGGFDKLADKHLKDEKETFKEMGIPFFFD